MWVTETRKYDLKWITSMLGISTNKKYVDLGRTGVYTTFQK
jgi:hypothetical protein